MIPKKNRVLIPLLLLVGIALLSVTAFAGQWRLTYSSPASASNVGFTRVINYGNDPDQYASFNEPQALWCYYPGCKTRLSSPAKELWVDPHINIDPGVWVWGDWWGAGSGFDYPRIWDRSWNITDTGPVTLHLQWEGAGSPPARVGVKYATAANWYVKGVSVSVSAEVNNPCEDKYGEFSYQYSPDGVTIGKGFGAYSYGLGYAVMDGSSGSASVDVPLSLDMSAVGVITEDPRTEYYIYAWVLSTLPASPQRMSNVPWRTPAPHCYFGSFNPGFDPRRGGTQSGGDPVDLATGAHLYLPEPDITCYNPCGPTALYQRNYLSLMAEYGSSSPGLSPGWVDNYDVKIWAMPWDGQIYASLVYPNSAQDTLDCRYPELSGPISAPYFITSVPSETPDTWESITLTFKDQTQWVFTTDDGLVYYLSRIANRLGRYISIIRDANNGYRLSSVTDDSTPANELLSFNYDGNNLSYMSDAYGRKVIYTFGSAANATCLLSVSQIAPLGALNPSSLEQYGYTSVQGYPHITAISTPSPTGSGLRTETISYNTSTLMVNSLVDANGNQCVFAYDGYNGKTKVQVKDSRNVVAKEWIECFDPANQNVQTGTVNPNHRATRLLYEDPQNSGRPTMLIDREGKTTSLTYDKYGNVLTSTDPRGTTTTYWYNYPDTECLNDEYPDLQYPTAFSLGRLMKVQQGTKAPTTFTYYEPSGLIHTITTPKPGTTGGSETVTTTFTYDSIGNILTRVVPGNPNNQTITYNYTLDGTYTQPARLGQPLIVMNNLGHVTHYRYDDRGNTTSVTDALGNETDYMYNIADQLTTIINPPSQ